MSEPTNLRAVIRIVLPLVLSLAVSTGRAAQMERCSYKTDHDGEISSTVESPDIADGSSAKRFAEIRQWESEGKEGWKGFRTFDVDCQPLDATRPEYNLFVQTHNGQVSLQHGLTEDACYYVLHRLSSSPCTNCVRYVQPADFQRGECFK